MKVVKWDPFFPLRSEFGKSFYDFLNPALRNRPGFIEPPVDIIENDENITVRAQVPGIPKENIKIEINGEQLTIKGEHRQEKEEKKENYYRQEIQYGSFYRLIDLPFPVDKENVHASMKDGMLEIALKKNKASQPKKIEIK